MQGEADNLSYLSTVLGGTFGQGGVEAGEPGGQTHYPAGSQQSFVGPAEYFTGEVQVEMLFSGNETAHYSAAYVTFQPGARTAWHLHPAGQHMIVTKGVALTGTRDGEVIEFAEGETVWCPSNIDHWHGATPEVPMTHLVITGNAINTFLQSHLFGDLFGRDILDCQSREIATLSALANTAGVESQLQAHVGIATHVGLTEAQLAAWAAVLNQRVGMPAGRRAEQALQAVLSEGGGERA